MGKWGRIPHHLPHNTKQVFVLPEVMIHDFTILSIHFTASIVWSCTQQGQSIGYRGGNVPLLHARRGNFRDHGFIHIDDTFTQG